MKSFIVFNLSIIKLGNKSIHVIVMSYGQRVRANLRVVCVYGFRIDSKIDLFEIGCVIYILCCVIYSRNKNAQGLSSEFSVKLNCETRNEA